MKWLRYQINLLFECSLDHMDSVETTAWNLYQRSVSHWQNEQWMVLYQYLICKKIGFISTSRKIIILMIQKLEETRVIELLKKFVSNLNQFVEVITII